MKKVFLIIAMVFLGLSVQAQKKSAKKSLKVEGVSIGCKKRIEKAALKTKGVKYANWDLKTKQLSLIIDERKTNLKTISENIAAIGNDTELTKASDKAYNSLSKCCQYRKVGAPTCKKSM